MGGNRRASGSRRGALAPRPAERFLHAEQRQDLWHGEDIGTMLEWMQNYQPAQASKWIDEKRRSALV